MKYFAFYGTNNVVSQVLPVPDSASEEVFSARIGLACKETFKDGTTRGKFAGVGYLYIEENDIFVKPKIYNSWVLDASAAEWVPPSAKPTDGQQYIWNEADVEWQAIGLEHSPAKQNLSDSDMDVLRNKGANDTYDDVLAKLSPEGRAWAEGVS